MGKDMVIGVTGGIASGKTTVSRMLADLGAVIIDADQIGREVVEDCPGVLSQLVQAFGQGILTKTGILDRRKLGRIAFSSAEARDRLNAIVHPHLLRELSAQVKRAAADHPERAVVIDAALLFEWILHPSSACLLPRIDATVVVLASEATQMARLVEKGFTLDEAQARIQAQLSSDEKAARADYVLYNEGSLESLEHQVCVLWQQLCRDL